jgi:hypothetical protein
MKSLRILPQIVQAAVNKGLLHLLINSATRFRVKKKAYFFPAQVCRLATWHTTCYMFVQSLLQILKGRSDHGYTASRTTVVFILQMSHDQRIHVNAFLCSLAMS